MKLRRPTLLPEYDRGAGPSVRWTKTRGSSAINEPITDGTPVDTAAVWFLPLAVAEPFVPQP